MTSNSARFANDECVRTLNIEGPHRSVQCVTLYCVTFCASKGCRVVLGGWAISYEQGTPVLARRVQDPEHASPHPADYKERIRSSNCTISLKWRAGA